MYGVNSGVNFPKNYYGKNTQPKGPSEQQKAAHTKSKGRTDEILFSAVTYRRNNKVTASLSDDAKSLLSELREKYKGYDFMVADFETDEEASELLSQGRGEYNVLITPELLEKMASDTTERAKYEDIISGAASQFDAIEKDLTEDGRSIVDKLGFTVKGDGTVDYYASLVNGVTSGGSKTVKASLVTELSSMVNKLAEERAKALEEAKNKDPEKTLSKEAAALLSELREKYKNYDFIVGDLSLSDKLSGSSDAEMTVLITPDLLEKMAADKSVRTKYENIIEDAAAQFADMKADLTPEALSGIDKLGITVKDDGGISFYAFLSSGFTTADGKNYVDAESTKGLVGLINSLAIDRTPDKEEDSKPVDKEAEKEKSVLPPKSFEKYRKEKEPYSTEEDYGNLPPESFEKYKKEENPYSTEEDYGTLPPESFKKYQTEASAKEDPGSEMNFSV